MADSTSESTQSQDAAHDEENMDCTTSPDKDDNTSVAKETPEQEKTNVDSTSDLITPSSPAKQNSASIECSADKNNSVGNTENTTGNTENTTGNTDNTTTGNTENTTSNTENTSGSTENTTGNTDITKTSNVDAKASTSGGGDCNEPKTSDNEPVTDPYHYTKGQEFTSEVFKIEIRNLPRYFGFNQLKKQLVKLKLNPKKVKAMKGNHGNFGFVTFTCEEDKQKALKVLDGYYWKKSTLIAVSAKPVADPIARNALKRKQEESRPSKLTEEQEANKRRKQEEQGPIEHRLNDAVTPLWRKSYEDQLKMKDDNMKEFLKILTKRTLEQIGATNLKVMNPDYLKNLKNGVCCPIETIKPSPVLNGYRNKCEFTVGISLDGEGKTVGFRLGSYKGGQISVVDPSECVHLSNPTKEVVKCFQKYIRQVSKLSGFDPVTHNGHWRMLTVRTNTRGDIMAIVVMHPHQLTKEEIELEKQQLSDFFQSEEGKDAAVTSFYLLQQSSTSREEDSSQKCELIYGVAHITEDILGLSFRISPDAFFQVNSKAAEVLYSTVADFAEVNEDSTVLDICCGTGTIGISIAKRVNEVIGIEVNKQAVQDAIYNAEKNGLTNVSYKCGKAEDVMPNITNNLKSSKDIIGIVDPPRAGCAFKVLQAIRRCDNLRRLVYVSCNPHNAINNFIDLCRPPSNKHKGTPFWPVKAVPVDLFPHTKHCELVILFERELEERTPEQDTTKEAKVEDADIKKMDITVDADVKKQGAETDDGTRIKEEIKEELAI